MLSKLENSLVENHITLKQANLQDIYQKIYIFQKDKPFEEFIKLITTFLSLFKSNNLQLSNIDKLLVENQNLDNNFLKSRNELFLKIFKNFFDFYETSLNLSGKIDFNDMINKSTEIINCGFIHSQYKYIIIDEYQDISVSRFKLIKALQLSLIHI